jgi:prephenate dehydrogenase
VDKAPVCVVGLGLIGGSVLRAAAAAGREVFGYNRSVEAVQAARFDGFDVTPRLDEALNLAVDRNALIVLAVPAPALPILLPYLKDTAPANPITDVISVKTAVLEQIQKVGLAANFVGGHPMAGTTHSGWSAGDAGLFVGAPWVVTVDDHVDPHCFVTVTELALDCGAIVVPARSDEHDAAAAAISHLPHLVAEAVALTAGEVPLAFALAAGSFRDVTRVAATTPELVRAFCEANADRVLPVLDHTIELLTRASTALAQNGSIADLVDGGHAARTRYDSFSRYEITAVVVGDEGWRQTLSAAGRAGGVIRSVPPVRDSPG